MRDCLSEITTISIIESKKIKPSYIQVLPVWDTQKYQIKANAITGKWDEQSILITKAGIQKVEKLGPNSIFDLRNYC